MPISGGGGSGGGGGTPTLPLDLTGSGEFTVTPTDNTLGTLVAVTAPSGFEINTTGNGDLLALVAEDGTLAFEQDTYGDTTLKAPTGMGNPFLQLKSTDHASFLVNIGGASSTLSVTDTSGNVLLAVSSPDFSGQVQLGHGTTMPIVVATLPSTDPGVAGQLYETGGVVMVSL